MTGFDVRPVTSERWKEFAAFFEATGSPHFCWCTPHRFHALRQMTKVEKRSAMAERVRSGLPIGVLAYDGNQPVGWCSIAPRPSYQGLERSRTMPRVTGLDRPTWTVLCFFVARTHRGRGVASALLEGGIEYARGQGAQIIEGYPFDAAGISATNRGHSHIFAKAGFRADGRRYWLEVEPLG